MTTPVLVEKEDISLDSIYSGFNAINANLEFIKPSDKSIVSPAHIHFRSREHFEYPL